MSYTMTIEEPEKAALLERVSRGLSSAEMGALFVAFLAQREGSMKHQTHLESLPVMTRKLAGVAKDVALDVLLGREPFYADSQIRVASPTAYLATV